MPVNDKMGTARHARLLNLAAATATMMASACGSNATNPAKGSSGDGQSASGSTTGAGSGSAGSTTGGATGTAGSAGSAGSSGTSGTAGAPMMMATIPTPDGGTTPEPGQTTLPLTTAPALGALTVLANRSSVRLYLPGVTGAHDYRAFAVTSGVTVSTLAGNAEHVDGATIFCAGLRQRNQCEDDEILPDSYNNPILDMPRCEDGPADRRPNVPTQLMQTMDMTGLAPNTTIVVEALDRQCPFPGLFGTTHMDVPIANVDIGPAMINAVVNNMPYTLQLLPATFPLRTEAEIRAQYGSMIFNGQGPNLPVLDSSNPAFPESPFIRVGQPAPANDPVVLSRAVVVVSPSGDGSPLPGFTADDYFDDFSDDTDQPVLLRNTDPAKSLIGGTVNVYTTKKWVLYDVGNQFSNMFVDRGALNMVMGDPYQDSMSVQAMYPKRAVQLPTVADQYLHVTYEAQRNETARRYENFTLCGSDKMGQTYTGDTPAAAPEPHPGFMDNAATGRTSVLGWNCLTMVGRGPGYYGLAGGDVPSHADTSLRVTVMRTQPPPADVNAYNTQIPQFASLFGPDQDGPFPQRWERQVDNAGNLVGVWLDDQMNTFQTTRFDVFIRRDRVVEYVEGQQRICQDLDPTTVTMAEGALGFWHILYHTSAEFGEIRAAANTANPSTGQHHVMHNTPFADYRTFDNVGFQENVAAPSNFDVKQCVPAGSPDGGQ